MSHLSFRIDDDALAHLDALCSAAKMDRSAALRLLIERTDTLHEAAKPHTNGNLPPTAAAAFNKLQASVKQCIVEAWEREAEKRTTTLITLVMLLPDELDDFYGGELSRGIVEGEFSGVKAWALLYSAAVDHCEAHCMAVDTYAPLLTDENFRLVFKQAVDGLQGLAAAKYDLMT